MKTILQAASDEELRDLHTWLMGHIGEEGVPKHGFAAAWWLRDTIKITTEYPAAISIPEEHIEAMMWAIEDWIEVLGAHDEPFQTQIVVEQS